MNRVLLSAIALALITSRLPAAPLAPGKVLTFRHDGGAHAVALSPDGKLLATGGDSLVIVWDVETGKERHRLEAHRAIVHVIAFSPDGKSLATAGRDRVIHLWDSATGKSIRELNGHDSAVTGLAFTPDGKGLFSASFDATVRLWDVTTGKQNRSITGHEAEIRGMVLAPDGKLLATAGYDRTVRIWDTATGKEVRKLIAHKREALCVAFSPDGKTLATGGADQRTFLWDVSTGEELRGMRYENGPVFGLAFSPDGRTLAVAAGASVFLHETVTGARRYQLAEQAGRVADVAFSADGRAVVAGNVGGTAVLASPFPAVTGKLTPEGAEARWRELGSPDAGTAWRAMAALVSSPTEAVPLLQKQLRPPAPLGDKQVARLLADLDSDDFTTREKATVDLERAGAGVLKAVQQFLAKSPSLEAKRRAERVVAKIEEDNSPIGGIRDRRAVECLEWIGTEEARQMLRTLAGGVAEAQLTREANAALARLERRH